MKKKVKGLFKILKRSDLNEKVRKLFLIRFLDEHPHRTGKQKQSKFFPGRKMTLNCKWLLFEIFRALIFHTPVELFLEIYRSLH